MWQLTILQHSAILLIDLKQVLCDLYYLLLSEPFAEDIFFED